MIANTRSGETHVRTGQAVGNNDRDYLIERLGNSCMTTHTHTHKHHDPYTYDTQTATNSTEHSCSVKLTVPHPVKNSPPFCRTRRFIANFTKACHLSLFQARSIQSANSHPIPLRCILTSTSHPHPGPPSVLFRSSFPTKKL